MHGMAASLSQRAEEESREKKTKRSEGIEISEAENSFPMRFLGEDRPEMEYRPPLDDAWYGVTLFLVVDVLVVRYDGFSGEDDEVFPASDEFSSSDEITQFGARFRPASLQMQDSQCRTVREGTEVCASYHFDTGDVKFYDATVVRVQRAKHVCEDGQNELCRCTYWLSWRHGPLLGKVTPAKIDDICLRPENKRFDPLLIWFLNKANQNLPGNAQHVPESSGTTGMPKHRLSSCSKGTPATIQRKRVRFLDNSGSISEPASHKAGGSVAKPSSRDNSAARSPLSRTIHSDLFVKPHEPMLRPNSCDKRSQHRTLCYPHKSASNSEVSLHRQVLLREQMKHGGLPKPKLFSPGGGIVIREETKSTDAPRPMLPLPQGSEVASEQVTQANERDAVPHQQHKNNEIEFYSRQRARRKKLAIWRKEAGKLCGMCKKRK